MAQIAYPVSDVSDGTWRADDYTANLYARVDDASDGDYIYNMPGDTSTAELHLDTALSTPGAGDVIITTRQGIQNRGF